MRTLGFLLLPLALAACATLEQPMPLTGAEIVALAHAGRNPQQIIAELKRTDTALPLQASDIVALHDSGVPNEVLDYLQRAQIDEIRWRDRYAGAYWYGYGPLYRGLGPCPWPPIARPYREWLWGC